MRPRLVALAVAATGLLLAAAPVLAAPATLEGRAVLPLEIGGQHEATGLGAFLASGNAGTLDLQLDGATGTLVRVQHRAYGYLSDDPKVGVLWGATTQRIPLDLEGATLTLTQRLPGFQFYAEGDALRMTGAPTASSPLLIGGLAEPKTVGEALHRPLTLQLITDEERYSASIPAGHVESRAQEGRLAAAGPVHFFLAEATLRFERAGTVQELPASFRTEERPGQLFNPVTNTWFGPGTHTEYVQESLQIDATGGLAMAFANQPGTLYSPTPTIRATGQAILPGLSGTVRVAGTDGPVVHSLNGQSLTLNGTYTLRLDQVDERAQSARVQGEGDLSTIAYGTITAHYPWGATVAAVGLGALVLAGAAWLLAHGKALLGGAAGSLVAGYARVQGEEILEHPGRAEVYERIKAWPGVSFAQLDGQVDFGASTLTYHLRVLEKNDYIHTVRDGRYLRLFDKRSGHYSGERKTAVSALRNTTSAAMARHVREHPGVPQSDLARAFGVTPSTVTWHMNRLAAAGLIEKLRDGIHSRYYLAQGWAELPADEQNRQAMVAVPA